METYNKDNYFIDIAMQIVKTLLQKSLKVYCLLDDIKDKRGSTLLFLFSFLFFIFFTLFTEIYL